jgi:multimeric flavodoxin WrbA
MLPQGLWRDFRDQYLSSSSIDPSVFPDDRDTTIPDISPEKLAEYDGFLLGIPTRYGNNVAQWRQFWDQTGGLWAKGGFHGKFAGIFVSTGTLGGGKYDQQ